MKKLFLILVAFVSLPAFHHCYAKEPTRDERELDLAEYSILSSLIADSFVKTRYRCSQNDQACIGGNPAELGLALIASKSSSLANKRLVQLLRYRLDGGLATDFTCYVAAKGKAAEKLLKAQVPANLNAQCVEDVSRLMSRMGKLFDGFNSASVCSDSKQIAEKQSELLAATLPKTKCDF